MTSSLHSRLVRTLLHAAALCLPAWCVPAVAQGWQPDRNVEVVVGTAAGGSLDAGARLMQLLWQQKRLAPTPAAVMNRPGAGGTLALVYLNQHPADGHYVAVVSNPLLTNHITGGSTITYRDVTPLALLFDEYIAFAVRPGTPIASGRDLVERLGKDPASVSVALFGIGSANHVALSVAAKSAGADIRKLKVVTFPSIANAVPALLGGHVDVVVAPVSNLVPHAAANSLRIIAVAAPRRLGGPVASAPTWREQGVDAVVSSWRGVVGPRGLTPAQVAYWERLLEATTQTEEWRTELDRNQQDNAFRRPAEFQKYLAEQHARLSSILGELGLAK
jgi:putative tricarboxylic transport membrane protein